MVGVMLGFGAALAFVILYVTQSVRLAERPTEFATLRACGAGHGRSARQVSAEGLIVTVLALGPGLVLGAVTAHAFLDSIGGLASQWPALRAIHRLDLAQVFRERAV